VDDFPGAEEIPIPLDSPRPGDCCPKCAEGAVYAMPPAQYGIISPVKKMFEPILAELIRQAACGELVYNDDTTNRILSMMGKRAQQQEPPADGTRRS
jgi:hypothetical protein